MNENMEISMETEKQKREMSNCDKIYRRKYKGFS